MAKFVKNNLGLFLVVGLVLVVGFCLFRYFPARASGEQINIFPTSYNLGGLSAEEAGWQNPEAAFSQDLSGDAGLEEFNENNSAYSFFLEERFDLPYRGQTSTSTPETIIENATSTPGTIIENASSTPEIIPYVEVKPLHEQILEFSNFGISNDEIKSTEIKNVQLRFSLAGKPRGTDAEQDAEPRGKILIDYQIGNTWQKVGEIVIDREISNATNGGYWLYGLPVFEKWEDLENLKVRFQVSGFRFQVLMDAVWLEVEYEEIEESIIEEEEPVIEEPEAEVEESEEEYALELISNKKDFKLAEEPSFKFRYQKKKGFFESIGSGIWNLFRDEYKDINIKAAVSGLNISPKVRYQKNGEFFVDLSSPPRQFRPGRYTLKIEIEDKGQIFVQNQSFVWGVLAINTNKSIYLSAEALAKAGLPNEIAYLQMAVLDNGGHTICDAKLELRIINHELGIDTILSTNNGTIQYSGQCEPNNVTDVPDYFAYYQVRELGIYQMILTNLDNGYTITDSFEVRDSVPFNIERIGPTRIYPLAVYEVILRIKANQDFKGQVIEQVPANFETTQEANWKISFKTNTKSIIWDVDWKTGETYELKYTFDAPDISPYLYLLGPLELTFNNEGFAFGEIRQWQIASDATIDSEDWEAFLDEDVTLDGSFWSNLTGDDCDMQTLSGATPSSNTGPSIDHTYGDASHMFLYLETSSGWCQGDGLFAQVETDDIDADTYSVDIDFWWHMYGSTIGSLHLDVYDGTWHESEWSRSGEGTPTADAWYNQQVDLDSYTGTIKLRFRAISAGNYYGDAALDDIEITGTLRNAAPNTPTLEETPTFANMDTNDTTPDLGDFKASDDDSDDLVYEIQWDTSYDFDSGNLKTKTSDIDSGFVNTEDGGDTSPFTHNQKIRFTVQAGDAMTNGNTYWWRVKACDPSDACSSYSAKRSITIDDSLTVDQWLQTTTEQFGTDTLTDTEAAAGSVKLGGW